MLFTSSRSGGLEEANLPDGNAQYRTNPQINPTAWSEVLGCGCGHHRQGEDS